MTVTELMASITVDPDFEGEIMADDMVLAVNPAGSTDAEVGTYVVVQEHIIGVDAQMNATTADKTYIRAGTSTSKTGSQRVFNVTGDMYIGDDFQDLIQQVTVKYGVGQSVIHNYVYFDIKRGKGEKGIAAIIVNSDGSGNAGENATIDVDIRKSGATPADYQWVAAGG